MSIMSFGTSNRAIANPQLLLQPIVSLKGNTTGTFMLLLAMFFKESSQQKKNEKLGGFVQVATIRLALFYLLGEWQGKALNTQSLKNIFG